MDETNADPTFNLAQNFSDCINNSSRYIFLLKSSNSQMNILHLVLPFRLLCWSKPSKTNRSVTTMTFRRLMSGLTPCGRTSRRPSSPSRSSPVNVVTWPCTRRRLRMSWRGTRGSSRTKTTGRLPPHAENAPERLSGLCEETKMALHLRLKLQFKVLPYLRMIP